MEKKEFPRLKKVLSKIPAPIQRLLIKLIKFIISDEGKVAVTLIAILFLVIYTGIYNLDAFILLFVLKIHFKVKRMEGANRN